MSCPTRRRRCRRLPGRTRERQPASESLSPTDSLTWTSWSLIAAAGSGQIRVRLTDDRTLQRPGSESGLSLPNGCGLLAALLNMADIFDYVVLPAVKDVCRLMIEFFHTDCSKIFRFFFLNNEPAVQKEIPFFICSV